MEDISHRSFAIVPNVLEASECAKVEAEIGPAEGAGWRDVLELPGVAELARSERLLELVRPHVPGEPFAVRAIYFHKSAEPQESLKIRRIDVLNFGSLETRAIG